MRESLLCLTKAEVSLIYPTSYKIYFNLWLNIGWFTSEKISRKPTVFQHIVFSTIGLEMFSGVVMRIFNNKTRLIWFPINPSWWGYSVLWILLVVHVIRFIHTYTVATSVPRCYTSSVVTTLILTLLKAIFYKIVLI